VSREKNSASFTITTGSAFSMTAEVRAGAAHDYAGTVPGGQALDSPHWAKPRVRFADRSTLAFH